MAKLWRIAKARYAATVFDGEGPRLYGGRWNSPGVRVAYASGSIALAILEVLVHLKASQFLRSYLLVYADVPDDLIEVLPPSSLPPTWRQSPAPPDVAAIGDSWVSAGTAAVLRVPSAIVASESNYLLNPAHPAFARIAIGTPEPFSLDQRLVK